MEGSSGLHTCAPIHKTMHADSHKIITMVDSNFCLSTRRLFHVEVLRCTTGPAMSCLGDVCYLLSRLRQYRGWYSRVVSSF